MFRSGWRARAALLTAFLIALACGLFPAAGPASAAAPEGAWSPTGALGAGRAEHRALTIQSGKVLVAGGRVTPDMGTATAELYDPATGTWSPAASMSTPRVGHTMTLLSGGDVLVTGGSKHGGAPLASAERYHPATGTWSAVPDMPVARRQHTATRLSDGRVLVVGTEAAASLYDPATNSWSAAGTLATARYRHTATHLASGKVLVTGGHAGNFLALASAELYDPATNSWSAAGSLQAARFDHAAVRLNNNLVLVVGGSGVAGALASAELYDPTQNGWVPTGSLAIVREDHSARLLADGRVLAVGGVNGIHGALASVELYDPGTGLWSLAGGLTARRDSAAAVNLIDGRVLAIGGFVEGAILASVDAFDLSAPAPSFPLTVQVQGPGSVTGALPGQYLAGSPIQLIASPDPGAIFTGWHVNGALRHWTDELDIAITGPHTVVARFAAPPTFDDVPPGHPAREAITQLAARGIIQGYGNGNFGPGDTTLRAQMAALIARPFGWDQESHPNPFVDRGSTGDNLWASVAALAHYNVALGYDGVHFGPNNQVTRAQTISFIARAMVARGFWSPIPDFGNTFTNVPASSGHRHDLATYDYYTGALPGQSDNATFPDWSAPATRGWFAQVLWQALNAHYNQR